MSNKRFIVKRSILEDFIKKHKNNSDLIFESNDDKDFPIIKNEMPFDDSRVSMVSDNQVVDAKYPIDDRDWYPGSMIELKKACSQMCGDVPNGHLKWFWGRFRELVRRVNEPTGTPGSPTTDREKVEVLPADKQKGRKNELGVGDD